MSRIKIKDLPKNMKVTKEEMKKVHGGLLLESSTLVSYEYPETQPLSKHIGGVKYED